MPLVVSVSALVALATGSWTVLAVGAATEVFLLALLYGCLAYNFRNVSIDPELVAKHVGRYGQSEDDDARLKDKRREVLAYQDVALTYYNLSTGWFHKIFGAHYSMGIQFPTENLASARPGETRIDWWMNYPQAQSVYQAYLALSLGLGPNAEEAVIGDFGCGIGGPTRLIAQFTGARIKAVNINKMHLAMMKELNQAAHIDHRIELINADYHHTPIASDSLDGVYMCESAACTHDHKVLCAEVFRVLKPGACYTGFDWQMTDKFDETNAEHRRVRFLLEKGVGVPRLVPMAYMRAALHEAGFEVITDVRNHSDWATKLGGKPWDGLFTDGMGIERNTAYQFKAWLTSLFQLVFRVGAMCRVVHPCVPEAIDIMIACREGMVRGGPRELDIFTPMAFWVARKPLKNKSN